MAKKTVKPTAPVQTDQEILQSVFNKVWMDNVQLGYAYAVRRTAKSYIVVENNDIGCLSPIGIAKSIVKVKDVTSPLKEMNNVYARAARNVLTNMTDRKDPYSREQRRKWRKEIKNNLIYFAVRHKLTIPPERDYTGSSLKD